MRNQILIIYLLLGLSLPLTAQTHSALEISVGGGWSTLGYKVQPHQADVKGTNKGSWGAQAHVGYALFFTPNVGLGVGANFSHYGANASLSGIAQWNDVRDTEGERYNHLTIIHSLNDKQDIYLMEIPITLYLSFPISYRLHFNLEAGAKYGIPILKNASFHADVEHQGNYGIWGLNIYDVPNHGFYRERDFNNTYSIAVKDQLSVFLKLGLAYDINRKMQFFANIYGDYGFKNTVTTGNTELGFKNDRAGMASAHSFMPDYNGIIATNNISSKSHPLQIGLEVGLRFIFPHKRVYSCRCML